MDGIASSATAVLLGYLLANTKKIGFGSGGIMLPNHAPLVVAEQFGTLATLYPNRIELGLGWRFQALIKLLCARYVVGSKKLKINFRKMF